METKGLQLGSTLYVDIESLFDLRLSTVKFLFPSIYKKILKEPLPYLGRMSDFIDTIPKYFFNEVYKELFDLGYKRILKTAIATSIINIINAELSILELKRLADVLEGKILNIHVNLFPFDLTEEEKNELLVVLRTLLISGNVEINFINKDPKVLTTKDLDTYDSVIMYRGLEWLNFALLIEKYNVPQVKMYIPALITNGEINVKTVEDLEDYFNNISEMFKPIIDLTFLPAELFSINPSFIKEKKE